MVVAQGPGKLKTVMQNIFVGGTILWFAFRDAWNPLALHKSPFWQFWKDFHGHFVSLSLGVASPKPWATTRCGSWRRASRHNGPSGRITRKITPIEPLWIGVSEVRSTRDTPMGWRRSEHLQPAPWHHHLHYLREQLFRVASRASSAQIHCW